MKRKILSGILTIMLIFGMLIGLTACGEKDGKDKKSSKNTESMKKIVSEFIDCMSSKDYEGLAKLIDVKGMVAYTLVRASDLKINRAYDFVCDLEKGADYLNKNYKDIMEAVGEKIDQQDVDGMIDSMEELDFADMFADALDGGTQKIKLEGTEDVEKEDDGTYSIVAEISNEDDTQDMTFYFMKVKDEYRMIYVSI